MLNQVDPLGGRYESKGERFGTLTGNADFGIARIICTLELQSFSGERKYQRLFFLDEATAIAAGHRPCGTCQKPELKRFKSAWSAAGKPRNSVGSIDADLRADEPGFTTNEAGSLPDGAMVRLGDSAHLVVRGSLRPWAPWGYGYPVSMPDGEVRVLTPGSAVEAIRAGYQPRLHPSAV